MRNGVALALSLGLGALVASCAPIDDDPVVQSRTAQVTGDDAAPGCLSDGSVDRPYQDLETLSDSALKTALFNRIRNQTALSYKRARSALFVPSNGGIDVNQGWIECLYTGRKVKADGSTDPGGLNTEHSWPQSLGAQRPPAESDLHHLFATDSSANSRRGNLPFGETDCADSQSCDWMMGGSKLGPVRGGAAKVFDVRLERRGDIARALFYFSVRYQKAIADSEEEFLRAWNQADPPDALELERNVRIVSAQKNSNPFVERPDFVNQIDDF
jgi:endonuclease I